MNLEYMSWLNLKVKCLSIISQNFLFCFYIEHVLIRGSFVSCYNSLVSKEHHNSSLPAGLQGTSMQSCEFHLSKGLRLLEKPYHVQDKW